MLYFIANVFSTNAINYDLRIIKIILFFTINTPTYLTDLPHLKTSTRPLINSNTKILTLPTINRIQHVGKAFRYMAAYTWNNLPDDIRKYTIYLRSDISL